MGMDQRGWMQDRGVGRERARHRGEVSRRWRGSERPWAWVRQLGRPQMHGSSPQKLSTPVENVDSGVDRTACRGRFLPEAGGVDVSRSTPEGWGDFFSTVLHTSKPLVRCRFLRSPGSSPHRCPQGVHATRRVLHTLSTRAVGNAVAPASGPGVVSCGIPNARAGIGRR